MGKDNVVEYPASPHYERGRVLFEQSRFDLAAEEFRLALADDVGNAYGHAALAACLAGQGKHEAALAEVSIALRAAPGLAYGHYVQAQVLTKERRFKEAEEAILKAIALEPGNADYHVALAATRVGRFNWAGALAAAEAGLALDPEHTRGLNVRAAVLRFMGKSDESQQVMDQALAGAPEHAGSHANLGWLLLQQGDHRKARACFVEALRLNPEWSPARDGLIEAFKASNPFYRRVLLYSLWMLRFAGKPGKHPGCLMSLLGLVLVPFLWISSPLFDLLLLVHPDGRQALSDRQKLTARGVGGILLGALAALVAALAWDPRFFGVAAILAAMAVLPTLNFATAPPRRAAILRFGTMVLAAVGVFAAIAGFAIPEAAAPARVCFFAGWGFYLWVLPIWR